MNYTCYNYSIIEMEDQKRNVVLLYRDKSGGLSIIGEWKDVTESELALKIIEDAVFSGIEYREEYDAPLFYELLYHNRKLLKGISFSTEEVCINIENWKSYGDMIDDVGEFTYEIINHLYTKILTPKRILKDIGKICEGDTFFICSLHN